MEEDIPKALEPANPRRDRIGPRTSPARRERPQPRPSDVLGPSLTFPIIEGRAALGTWQQVAFLELDNKPRSREVVIQVVGDATGDRV